MCAAFLFALHFLRWWKAQKAKVLRVIGKDGDGQTYAHDQKNVLGDHYIEPIK